jgi:hypothetical protein
MFRFIALPLIFVAGHAVAQDLSKPVNYRTVAIPLHSALEAIAKQSGVPLIASDELADEPIILVVNGSKTSDVMDHIASAMSASWKKSNKTFVLERSDEMEARLEAKDEADRAERLQKAIDACAKDAKIDQEWTPDYRDALAKTLVSGIKEGDPHVQQQSFARLPAERLIARLLQMIGAAPFAKMETTSKYCFATDANSMELPIPGDWKSVIDQYIDEQNSLSTAFKKSFGTAPPQDRSYMYGEAARQIDLAPTRLFITVSFVDGELRPVLSLMALREINRYVFQTSTNLDVPFTPEDEARFRKAEENSKTEQPIPLSKESDIVQESCRAVNKFFINPPRLTDDAAALMLDPANHDPLSFQISDGFMALASSQNVNLVAYPPDEMLKWMRSAAAERFTLSTFRTMLDSVHQDVKGDWLEISPKQPLEAWKTRCNRELAGDCFQEGQKLGYISIDTAAKLALSQRVPGQVPLLWVMEQFGTEYSPFYQRDTRLLRFYGSLDEGQLKMLAAGGLNVGGLQRDQYGYLQDWVYQSVYVNPDVPPQERSSVPPKLWSVTAEVVPEAVPFSAVIQATDSVSDITFVGLHFYNTAAPIDTFENAAFSLAWSKGHPEDETGTRVEWFAPGKAHDLALTISLKGEWKGDGHLREETMSDIRWTIDKLPADTRSKWEAAVADAQRSYDDSYPKAKPPPTAPPY